MAAFAKVKIEEGAPAQITTGDAEIIGSGGVPVNRIVILNVVTVVAAGTPSSVAVIVTMWFPATPAFAITLNTIVLVCPIVVLNIVNAPPKVGALAVSEATVCPSSGEE